MQKQPRRLSDFELVEQLYVFMTAVPALWGWADLEALHAEGLSCKETRGPDAKHQLQFSLSTLESGVRCGQPYLHIAVSVSAPDRNGLERGSAKVPLCASFLLFQNGVVEMPLASDIFETD